MDRVQALEGLLDLLREMLREADAEQLFTTFVDGMLDILGAERGFLVVAAPPAASTTRASRLEFRVVRRWARQELEAGSDTISHSIVHDVLQSRELDLIEDALADARYAERKSVREHGIRSVLAAPIELSASEVVVLYIESRNPEQRFGDGERELFARMIETCAPLLRRSTRLLYLEARHDLLERDLMERYRFPGIVGSDPGFISMLAMVGRAAQSSLPVLVQGASGSGKELVVRALVANSVRAERPYLWINCGAITPSLLESELFGHVKGAFTGAIRDSRGLIRSAHGGTLFLDEIGELSLEMQSKLLRTVQFGEVQPVGAGRTEVVDVRFVAATNRDLESEVQAGRFREDLYYRLAPIVIKVPSLKDRPGDVLPLFMHFLKDEAQRHGRSVPELTPRVERMLERYEWPGNVRELENEARRLLAFTAEGEAVVVDNLSLRLLVAPHTSSAPTLEDQERELIELHLRKANGNRTVAARNLGITREGLRKKLLRIGLS